MAYQVYWCKVGGKVKSSKCQKGHRLVAATGTPPVSVDTNPRPTEISVDSMPLCDCYASHRDVNSWVSQQEVKTTKVVVPKGMPTIDAEIFHSKICPLSKP